jgi:peptidoglycan/xylan/chitin deacetylase (PgdA/CDA1 family)
MGEDLLFSLTVDVEPNFGAPKPSSFAHIDRGVSNLLRMLDRMKINATFFVTKSVGERFPKIVKQIGRQHEIGLHGYAHECWGKPKWWLRGTNVLTSEQKQAYLDESIDFIKSLVKEMPRSFRAPYLVIDGETFKLLEESGFEVDSSAPSYYGVPPKPYHPNDLSLLEIPVSADPRPCLELKPLPHFRFDYLNTKLLGTQGVSRCANFVRDIVAYQLSRGITPHAVMLAHQWEFARLRKIPSKSFDYALMNHEQLLRKFFFVLRKRFKVKFFSIRKLAKVVA